MSAVTGVSSGTTNAATTNNKILGQDDFLKMLIAQLQNQDPLNPLQGADFAAQLAQFSSLDQLTQVNTQLSALASSLSSTNNSQLVGLIGNTVVANGNSVTVSGATTQLGYNLSQNARQGTIKIYDSQGNLAQTLAFGSQQAGSNTMNWNTSGVKPGTYTFTVSAVDSKGNPVTADAMTTGVVKGITFQNGVPYLSVNGQNIAFGNILYIAKPGS
ncbi:MAG: flagellar hook assembly protein FlgD [Syntrophales bacterium]